MSLSAFMRKPQIREAFKLYGNNAPVFLPKTRIKVSPMSETNKPGGFKSEVQQRYDTSVTFSRIPHEVF